MKKGYRVRDKGMTGERILKEMKKGQYKEEKDGMKKGLEQGLEKDEMKKGECKEKRM